MKCDTSLIPFINVRIRENRTATGKRTGTPAKRAALYYAYGRNKEAQLEGKQRGQWFGSDGRSHSQEMVMAWARENALNHRYTFQGILSVPEGALTAVDFSEAMQKGGQMDEWRLIVHDDTPHRHAHVLWFGDKRMDKPSFQAWQDGVRAELVRLEQQIKDRAAQQDTGLGLGLNRTDRQEIDWGW